MDVGQIGGKNFVYIVELHVKLRPKRIKIVEMRAKSVSWVKIRRFTPIFLPPGFLTKKHAKMGTFLNIFFSLFLTKKFPQLVNSRKKPFPSNSAHKWGHPQSSEWTRKLPHPLQTHNGRDWADWPYRIDVRNILKFLLLYHFFQKISSFSILPNSICYRHCII